MKFKKVLTVLCLSLMIPSITLADSDTGFGILPSAFKEVEEEEVDLFDSESIMTSIYDRYYKSINNGNMTGGKMDTSTQLPTGNTQSSVINGGSSGTVKVGNVSLNLPAELESVKKVSTFEKEPIPNNKTYKGTKEDIEKLVAYALSKQASETTGNYIYGGNNPDVKYQKGVNNPDGQFHEYNRQKGVDCSGFVMACYLNALGIKFNGLRSVTSYYKSLGVKIPYKDARPGDVVIFGGGLNSQTSSCAHTGIYLGEDKVIHASGTETSCLQGVTISQLKANPSDVSGGPCMKLGSQGVKAIIRVISIQ